MGTKQQMKRGKNQALYKYLPEAWIDFSVRGEERRQYVAKVVRWNSEKLSNINAKRLIRTVDEAVRAFEKQALVHGSKNAIVGFGTELTQDNCEVLSPKTSDEERGIIAQIDPLTFYCSRCKKVYQFNNEEQYRRAHHCMNPKCGKLELTQLRQIYFCECGYATSRHNLRCDSCHSDQYIELGKDYNFICTKCKHSFPMRLKCGVCEKSLYPKNALDPAQFFAFNLSLIDLIDERLEDFISKESYGAYVTFAYWLGRIGRKDFENIVKNGIISDPELYQMEYNKMYEIMFDALQDEKQAAKAAKTAADRQCGNVFNRIINELKGEISNTVSDRSRLAEFILEYALVKGLKDVSDLSSAIKVARLLNTTANPEQYITTAQRFGIVDARVCDKIPFVSCSYGYTREKPRWAEGVQLHALKEEKSGCKNIYAIKMNTEGVLFEFDRKKIIKWLIVNGIISEEEAPDINSEEKIKIWFLNNIKPSVIQRFNSIMCDVSKETFYVYRLIHSLSHILMRAAGEISGLGKDSLSEYIFPAIPAVLIYCQNSQGFNLGALFNTFEAHFDKWLEKAYSNAQKCIFDPICIEREKACIGCLFVNEISCQHNNRDLDRSLVIGHFDRKEQKRIVGFWEE